MNTSTAVCYLIHFDQPYRAKTGKQTKTARHYIGWTINLPERVKLHATNQGARLLQVVNADGIAWNVVRTWDNGSRDMEKKLKARHDHAAFCPICSAKAATR